MDENQQHERGSERTSEAMAKEASALGRDARDKVSEAAEPLKEKARNVAQEQKAAGADQLSKLGAAVHGAAGELEKEVPQAAQYVHSAAETLQNASSDLRNRSIEDIAGAFNNFARKQPAAAFASAVLAGFALARFLKSSSAEAQR